MGKVFLVAGDNAGCIGKAHTPADKIYQHIGIYIYFHCLYFNSTNASRLFSSAGTGFPPFATKLST